MTIQLRSKSFIILSIFFVIVVLGVFAHNTAGAAVIEFTGAVSDDWHTAGNWSTGKVPGPNDDVIIPVFTGVTNYRSVTLTGTLSNSGGFTNAGTFINSGTIFNNGYFANANTFMNLGHIDNHATILNDDPGTFVNAHTGSIANSDDINNEGNFKNFGSITGYVENFGTFTNFCGGTFEGIGPNDPIIMSCG